MATNRNQSIRRRECRGNEAEVVGGGGLLKLYDIPEGGGEGVLGWSGLLCSTVVPGPNVH